MAGFSDRNDVMVSSMPKKISLFINFSFQALHHQVVLPWLFPDRSGGRRSPPVDVTREIHVHGYRSFNP